MLKKIAVRSALGGLFVAGPLASGPALNAQAPYGAPISLENAKKAAAPALAAGGEGLRLLKIQGAVPVEGGIPLVMEGKIVGAIGVSGGSSAQDGQCAQAGAALK